MMVCSFQSQILLFTTLELVGDHGRWSADQINRLIWNEACIFSILFLLLF